MLESEFELSTPLYFVRRLNGMRATEKNKTMLDDIRARRVAYFSALGNLKPDTKEMDLWAIPEFDDAVKKKEMEELRNYKEFSDSINWGEPPVC